jgi:hypothetical protein
MSKSLTIACVVLALLVCSCKENSKYGYAIKDFNQSFQPYLTNIVSKGVVMAHDSALQQLATNEELINLAQSEHPVLRASAFTEMLRRNSFNHFEIIMNHLDDTAIVATDEGEWGILHKTVSDELIEVATWKDSSDRNKTIEQVITKHNYLRSAYTILSKIKPQEKYYSFIKEMAIRERKSITGYDKPWTGDLELALYALASFKKVEDIKTIKNLLLGNAWNMHAHSFKVLKEFPDTAYLDVFEKYYKDFFYSNVYVDRSVENAIDFIEALTTYKNERSVKILGAILAKNPIVDFSADTAWLKNRLVDAIWNNPCKAYVKLRRQIEPIIKENEKHTIALPADENVSFKIDNRLEKIGW